ncbi:MAG: hypothetical protein WCF94_01240 [bacterium]
MEPTQNNNLVPPTNNTDITPVVNPTTVVVPNVTVGSPAPVTPSTPPASTTKSFPVEPTTTTFVVPNNPANVQNQVNTTQSLINSNKETTTKHIAGGLAESWSKLGQPDQPIPELNKTGIIDKLQNKGYTYLNPTSGYAAGQNSLPVKSIIRTYKNDVAEAVKYNHISSIDIALAEQKKKETTPKSTPAPIPVFENKTENVNILAIISIVLLLAGIVAIGYVFYSRFSSPSSSSTASTTPVVISNFHTLLKTDSQQEIETTDYDPKRIALLLRTTIDSSAVAKDKFQEIILTQTKVGIKKQIDSSNFLYLNEIKLPESIYSALNKNFAYGSLRLTKNEPYLILSVAKQNITWATLIDWEGLMLDNLRQIFPITIVDYGSNNSSSSSTVNKVSDYFSKSGFKDKLIKNLATRYVSDRSGKTILIYCQPDENTIIFTSNEDALKALLEQYDITKSYRQ